VAELRPAPLHRRDRSATAPHHRALGTLSQSVLASRLEGRVSCRENPIWQGIAAEAPALENRLSRDPFDYRRFDSLGGIVPAYVL
jgi:hypothetical protein